MNQLTIGQKVAAHLYEDTWVEGCYQGIYLDIANDGRPIIKSKVSYGQKGHGYTIVSECVPLEKFEGVLSHDANYECWTGDIDENIDINFGVHHYHRYGGGHYR